LKAARRWAYEVKGVAEDRAEIIVCDGNFHGRTITLVGLSSEQDYKQHFGPFTVGFVRIPYGDAEALARAINPRTAAFSVEPIQGEAGIIVPPAGYLKHCAELCRAHNVLLLCDVIQTGLGRTGRVLACQHEGVQPDGITLGKALGGGLLPVSMFLARREVMEVFTPGSHGSTFGGNPLAAAVGLEALNVLVEERLAERAAELGEYFLARLRTLQSPYIRAVRGRVYSSASRSIPGTCRHGTSVRGSPPTAFSPRYPRQRDSPGSAAHHHRARIEMGLRSPP